MRKIGLPFPFLFLGILVAGCGKSGETPPTGPSLPAAVLQEAFDANEALASAEGGPRAVDARARAERANQAVEAECRKLPEARTLGTARAVVRNHRRSAERHRIFVGFFEPAEGEKRPMTAYEILVQATGGRVTRHTVLTVKSELPVPTLSRLAASPPLRAGEGTIREWIARREAIKSIVAHLHIELARAFRLPAGEQELPYEIREWDGTTLRTGLLNRFRRTLRVLTLELVKEGDRVVGIAAGWDEPR